MIYPVYAGTCKTPKNPKEKFVLAPEPVPYNRKAPTNRIEEVLSNRKTINVFRAWHKDMYDSNKYGLYWDNANIIPPKSFNFGIREIFWHYYSAKSSYHWYGDIYKFARKKWKDGTEYKDKINIDHTHIDYPKFITNIIKKNTKTMDGILFDWWHDDHEFASGFSKSKVKQSRKNIVKEVRNELGDDFLIMGNTNWRKDSGTHDTINGVFMELNKKNLSIGYSCDQIKNIEDIIKFHDQNLQEPRIIAVNPWRISKTPSKEIIDKLELEKFGKKIDNKTYKKFFKNLSRDKYWKFHYRSSPENIKFAKLFTAMAMVIPENGYILYGDNNPNPNHDHYHDFYEFYNTNLGKEISKGMEITKGLGFKMYEKGVIVYNRTKFKYTIKFKDEKKVEIGPLEGVFVKN